MTGGLRLPCLGLALLAMWSLACEDDYAVRPPDGAAPVDAAGDGPRANDGSPSAADVAAADAAITDAATPDVGPDAPAVPAVYVISTRIITPEQRQGLMFAVSSLEKGMATLDRSKAVELSTGAWIFGLPGTSYVYTAPFSEPTITRYEVGADGGFRMDRKMSFANLGLASAYASAYSGFLSPTKAYFVDGKNLQLVIWNPTEMSILGTIPIPVTAQGALQPAIGDRLVVRPDRIFAEVTWADPMSGWTVYGTSAQLFVVDPATDKIVDSSMVPDCGQLSASGGISSTGAAYFSPWDYRVAVRSVFGAPRGVASCAARIVPPGVAFDQGFKVNLDGLVGGRPAGDLRLVSDEMAVLHVFHQELAKPTAADWPDSRFKAHYQWWRWRIGSPAAELIPGQIPAAEGALFFRLGGRQFLPSNAADFSTTTLLEFDAQANIVEGLTGPGNFLGVVKVR